MIRDTGVQLLPSPLKAICSLHGLHMSDAKLGGTPPAIMANTTHVFTQLFLEGSHSGYCSGLENHRFRKSHVSSSLTPSAIMGL